MADEELRKIFTRRLNYYMTLNNFNQADLARYMKVSTATAAKWCTGQTMPRIDKIQSICNWLGVEKADLLDAEEKEDKYYINRETAAIAQEVYDNPDLRLLFDAARDVSPDNIRLAAEMLKRFKETNPDG